MFRIKGQSVDFVVLWLIDELAYFLYVSSS